MLPSNGLVCHFFEVSTSRILGLLQIYCNIDHRPILFDQLMNSSSSVVYNYFWLFLFLNCSLNIHYLYLPVCSDKTMILCFYKKLWSFHLKKYSEWWMNELYDSCHFNNYYISFLGELVCFSITCYSMSTFAVFELLQVTSSLVFTWTVKKE